MTKSRLPPSPGMKKGKKRIRAPASFPASFPTSKTCGTSHAHANDCIVQINDDLENMTVADQQDWKNWSIYKVPAYVAEPNGKAYLPQVVSFGPNHHGQYHLGPMENHKRRVRVEFIRRSNKPFKPFLESLRKEAGHLKARYDALHPEWMEGTSDSSADRFLELMITDGCFILEILMYAAGKLKNYEDNDPIFSKHGELYVIPFIRRDMLLLENQLPMLVLNRLFAFCYGKEEDKIMNRRILEFCSRSVANVSEKKCLHVLDVFRKNMLMEPKKKEAKSKGKCLHVLDVFRNSMLMEPKKKDKAESKGKCLHVLDVFRNCMLMEPKKKDKAESKKSEEIIRPATELHEHGIWFEKSDTDSLKDISFDGGVLKLPMIVVDEDTESMFLNLIAFERFHVGAGNEVTSYIFFMDNIIDKGQDVALLYTSGIINNSMESDEAAAKLFNSLATGVVLDPNSSLHDVINKVREYCMKKRHKWRANLIHTYFRNPWVTLSLIAAVLLFVLTIIQTVYAVLSYKK